MDPAQSAGADGFPEADGSARADDFPGGDRFPGAGGSPRADGFPGADEMVSRASRLAERITGIAGHGDAAEGRVTATWSHPAGLAELTIDRGLAQASSIELAQHVTTAVNAAHADFAARLRAASTDIAGATGLDIDALTRDPGELLSRVEHLGTTFAGQLTALLRDLAAQRRRAHDAAARLAPPPH